MGMVGPVLWVWWTCGSGGSVGQVGLWAQWARESSGSCGSGGPRASGGPHWIIGLVGPWVLWGSVSLMGPMSLVTPVGQDFKYEKS